VQGEFNQVILNIVINAAHAIEAAASDGRKGLIRIHTAVVEGCAEIRLEDNGQGIPPEIRHRVFDPFFTTKEIGKGTGQGLAISHAVIERHGGKIEFESVVGRGTTFIIRLPLEAPEPAAV
jgi:signal transduction histidine kinase